MKYSTRTGALSDLKTPCLVTSLAVAQQVAKSQGAASILAAATRDFADKPGKIVMVQLGPKTPQERLLIAGGADGEVNAADYQKVVKAAAAALSLMPVRSALWALTGAKVTERDVFWRASTALSALSSALYRFDDYKTSTNGATQLPAGIQLHADQRTRASVQRAVGLGQALKTGLDLARNLGNQPPNVCTPTYLLQQARKLGRQDKVSVTALDEKRMAELGMGAFLSVSRGSATPGKMVLLQYRGGKRGAAPVVLIGKGITFDTGGISLKPGAAMDEMKFDMCGAASVLGASVAAIEARLPINLVTILAAAENMPSATATRPGDIVTSLSGKTIEILNTDAEGRLVLCDAITYARRYKPRAVIDVATLTGAIITALGSHASAVFSKDDELANSLVEAGEWTGDRAWRMPLWDEYQSALKSNFADVPNIGGPGAGAITAACFLARFAEDLSWAHMDIAGSAFQGGPAKGATGRPVTLLFRYLTEQAGA